MYGHIQDISTVSKAVKIYEFWLRSKCSRHQKYISDQTASCKKAGEIENSSDKSTYEKHAVKCMKCGYTHSDKQCQAMGKKCRFCHKLNSENVECCKISGKTDNSDIQNGNGYSIGVGGGGQGARPPIIL